MFSTSSPLPSFCLHRIFEIHFRIHVRRQLSGIIFVESSHFYHRPRQRELSVPILEKTNTLPIYILLNHLCGSGRDLNMVTPPEQNFQPQTRDTTNGPHLHTYIPRSDGSIVVGGVAYVPQTVGSTIATTTVQVGTVPVAVQPAAIALPTVQLPLEYQYPVNFPSYIYQGASFQPEAFFLFSQQVFHLSKLLTIHL
jgi:hypothetical protein